MYTRQCESDRKDTEYERASALIDNCQLGVIYAEMNRDWRSCIAPAARHRHPSTQRTSERRARVIFAKQTPIFV